MTRTLRKLGASLLLGAALIGLPAQAMAQARPVPTQHSKSGKDQPVAGKVSLKVMAIHANSSGKVDPRLKEVIKQLKFTKYTGFKLLGEYPAQLAVGREASFQLAGGRKLKVELISRDAERAKIRFRMFKQNDKAMDTTVSINRNRSFIVAGPKYEDGVLILPITVSY